MGQTEVVLCIGQASADSMKGDNVQRGAHYFGDSSFKPPVDTDATDGTFLCSNAKSPGND